MLFCLFEALKVTCYFVLDFEEYRHISSIGIDFIIFVTIALFHQGSLYIRYAEIGEVCVRSELSTFTPSYSLHGR